MDNPLWAIPVKLSLINNQGKKALIFPDPMEKGEDTQIQAELCKQEIIQGSDNDAAKNRHKMAASELSLGKN